MKELNGYYVDHIHSPHITRMKPPICPRRSPHGASFSKATVVARTAIANKFITPKTNRI